MILNLCTMSLPPNFFGPFMYFCFVENEMVSVSYYLDNYAHFSGLFLKILDISVPPN